MMDPKALREQRAKLIADARVILDKAEKEKRALTAEEREAYDKHFAAAAALKDDITRVEAHLAVEAELRTAEPPQVGLETPNDPHAPPGEPPAERRTVELAQSVCGDARSVVLDGPTATPEYRAMWTRFLRGGPTALVGEEVRALQADSDTGGGYITAPQQFQAELIKGLDDEVWMRKLARVLPPIAKADSLGAPSLDADPADPTWTSELSIGVADASMTFGKRELHPHPLAQFLKVSKTLMRRALLPVDQIVRGRLIYKAGIVQENGFLNGTGAAQPLGVFTASDDGVGTARDVATGNLATELRFDGLKNAKFSLKAQYRRNAAWTFHRLGVAMISKLKDGQGRYLWENSVKVGEPDRILGLPVYESEYVPSTFTANLYVGMLADWRHYWIVDALTLTIQVLVELYAGTNQNGYLARLETDGMPVLAEAFARVKMGA